MAKEKYPSVFTGNNNTGLAQLGYGSYADSYFSPKLKGLDTNAIGSKLKNSVFDNNYRKGFDAGVARNSTGTNWFGKGGYIDGASQVVGAIGTGLQGYAALGQLGLAKKKFGFEKGVTNRNIYNQGTLVNNNMDNANNVGLALAGNTMTGAQKAASRQDILNRHVNVSAIG